MTTKRACQLIRGLAQAMPRFSWNEIREIAEADGEEVKNNTPEAAAFHTALTRAKDLGLIERSKNRGCWLSKIYDPNKTPQEV